jgi:hypothetical protein
VPTFAEAEVTVLPDGPLQTVLIRDLSHDGMTFLGLRPFKVGDTVRVSMSRPAESPSGIETDHVIARIVHSTAQQERVTVGVRFITPLGARDNPVYWSLLREGIRRATRPT